MYGSYSTGIEGNAWQNLPKGQKAQRQGSYWGLRMNRRSLVHQRKREFKGKKYYVHKIGK